MSLTALSSEFTVPPRFHTNRNGAMRFVFSYALHYWYLFLILFIGAVGNAALAAAVPMFIGQAFNAVLSSPPQTSVLPGIAFLIVGTQLVRAVLQFGRNFGAELIGQKVERDVRHEAVCQPVGQEHDLPQPAAGG